MKPHHVVLAGNPFQRRVQPRSCLLRGLRLPNAMYPAAMATNSDSFLLRIDGNLPDCIAKSIYLSIPYCTDGYLFTIIPWKHIVNTQTRQLVVTIRIHITVLWPAAARSATSTAATASQHPVQLFSELQQRQPAIDPRTSSRDDFLPAISWWINRLNDVRSFPGKYPCT